MPADIRADNEINPDTGIPKPGLDVIARPTDTFVKPVSASGRALGQLAMSLKSIDPAMGALADRFKEQETEQGTAQANVSFDKDGADWDKAVKNGDAPSWLNPYARLAARQQYGIRAGDKLAQDVAADPTTSPPRRRLPARRRSTLRCRPRARSGSRRTWGTAATTT